MINTFWFNKIAALIRFDMFWIKVEILQWIGSMSCSVTLQAHIYKIGSHELSMLNIFDFENDLALLCMTIGWLKFTYQRRKDEGMNVQYCVYSVWMWAHVSVWLEIYFLMLLYFILYLWFTFGFIHLRCTIQKKMCFFPTANFKCFFFLLYVEFFHSITK